MKIVINYLSVLILSVILLNFSSCYDDTGIQDQIDDINSKVVSLEQLTSQINTNITTLQTVVAALQNNDYVTTFSEIKEGNKVIGYVLTFAKSGPVTIYHGIDGKDGLNGKDGADGQDGADGKDGLNGKDGGDGSDGADGKDGADGINGTDGKDGKDGIDGTTPIIGVKLFTDGIYYWTLNNDWLTDNAGNKIRAVGLNGTDGKDGADGQDGADGKDGANGSDGKDGVNGSDGADGKDGITPRLKIESGNWFLSTDNGITWTDLGRATGIDGADGKDGTNGKDGANGANGQDGADGRDGADGDSFFQSVTQDDNSIYLTLANGTTITLPKEKPLSITFGEAGEISITRGATKNISYSIVGATSKTVVKAMGQNGWSARVAPTDNSSGQITVTAPNPLVEDEILVWVYDGENKTIMSSLNFINGSITVVSETRSFNMNAKSFSVNIDTDIDYMVEIPQSATSWLSVNSVTLRSAMIGQSINFEITENTEFNRYALVSLKNNTGIELMTIAIEQAGKKVADADGNIYTSVVIGNQQWLAENLKTTKYNDGTPIPLISDMYVWRANAGAAYCWFNDDKATFGDAYGSLYTWHVVNTGKLCPTGWHVPSVAEWETLTNYAGEFSASGGKLKSTRTNPDPHPRWETFNEGATDEFGFSALPGGYRDTLGYFDFLGYSGYWWSTNDLDDSYARGREMSYLRASVYTTVVHKRVGTSVRCVRDNY